MHNQNNTSRKIPTVKFVRADCFFFQAECFDAFFDEKNAYKRFVRNKFDALK